MYIPLRILSGGEVRVRAYNLYRMYNQFSLCAGFTAKGEVSGMGALRGSPRSRRLEVVSTRKNGHARRRHAREEPRACLPRAHPFSLSPTTSKRLLRRLAEGRKGEVEKSLLSRFIVTLARSI